MVKCKRLVIITAVIIGLTIVCSSMVSSSTKEYGIKSTFEYTVKADDTLSSIAEKYKPKDEKISIFTVKLQLLNDNIKVIQPGDKLVIPVEE